VVNNITELSHDEAATIDDILSHHISKLLMLNIGIHLYDKAARNGVLSVAGPDEHIAVHQLEDMVSEFMQKHARTENEVRVMFGLKPIKNASAIIARIKSRLAR
jgi:hypothetical protein